MPKSIVFSNAVLLVCLSALAGLGLPLLLDGGKGVAPAASTVWAFGGVAVVTGLVMLVTEMFSGYRVIALIAFIGVALGAAWSYLHGTGSTVAQWAWIIGLLAVVFWFASLASRARENR